MACPIWILRKSYRLMMLPLQNITQVITPVMHPIFSDLQNDKGKLATSYERIIRFLAFIGLPISVLLFFTAEEITLIIFGSQWLPPYRFRILHSLSDTDYPLIFRIHLSRQQATREACSYAVCFHRCSTWHGDLVVRHLPFRNADGSGQLHCGERSPSTSYSVIGRCTG